MENHKSYGDRLREARENLGLSVEDISFDLKINVKTLNKMEESKTNELPKAAFTRGFIKIYCAFLKISPALVISEYDKTLSEGDKKLSVRFLQEDSEPKDFFVLDFLKDQLFPILIVASVLSAAIVLYSVLGSYKPNQIASDKPELIEVSAPVAEKDDPEAEEVVAEDVKVIEEQPEQEEVKVEKQVKAKIVEEAVKPEPKLAEDKNIDKEKAIEKKGSPKKRVITGEHKLIVEPLAKTALYIKTDLDSKPVRATLRPDKLRTFQFDQAEVRFLDAGAVSLIFNGEDIGALGVFGEEKKIDFPSLKEL